MASIITHPVIAVGLAPLFSRCGVTPAVVCVGALSTMVPDLDVIGFRYGVAYGDLLGHRGLSHSLFFAFGWALLFTVIFRVWGMRKAGLAVFLFLFLCTASHGVLDALTNGGLGVAFFSPFITQRYFLPWRPIHVSPLKAAQFFSQRGLSVLRSELFWVVMPALIFGLITKLYFSLIKLSRGKTAKNERTFAKK